MTELLEIFSSDWALRALIASALVGITCGVLGVFIVLRNMSLIGDAISHAVLPGIFIAFLLVGYSTLGFFIGAVIAGIVSTSAMTWIQQKVKTKSDAAIGIVFTLMFSLGVIGISWLNNQQGAHIDLKDFLFGNVLGVSNEDLILTLFVCIYTIFIVVLFYRYLFASTFQPIIAQTMGISVSTVHYLLMFLLSFAVVSALRSVGVILVVAMLIIPSSTALLLSEKLKKVIIISASLGMISAFLGLFAAIIFNTTPGPMMVVASSFLYFIAVFFSKKEGLYFKWVEKLKQKNKIIEEDMIKYLMKERMNESDWKEKLHNELGISIPGINIRLAKMRQKGVLTNESGLPKLSIKGKELGHDLIRAHRLWETYQVNTMGLNSEQIHTEADRLEHHLTKEILDEVDKNLGYPKHDPHGSPIPEKKVYPNKPLINLNPKSKAKIAKEQLNTNVEGQLWELGLFPDTVVFISEIGNDWVGLKIGQKLVKIPADLAKLINIQ